MPTEVLTPTSQSEWLAMRAGDITSTEVAALFGCSPYLTRYELWHRKRDGRVVDVKPNERMTWGTRLQDAIAQGIAHDEGWTIRRMNEYMRLAEIGLGASFDFEATRGGIRRLLEIKNVDALQYRDGWLVNEDGSVEAPPHIELQVQQQMIVSGISQATIGALVGGNRIVLINRDLDPRIMEAIIRRAGLFWNSVRAGEEPSPDFERDADFIAELYGQATPGKVLNAHDDTALNDMAMEYDRLGYEIREAEKKRAAVKAQMLVSIGDTEKVAGQGWSLSAGVVKGGPVSYVREDYRNFRLTFKKTKAA